MSVYRSYGPFALGQAMAHLLARAEEGPLRSDQAHELTEIQREVNARMDLARLVAQPALEAARG